MVFSPSTELHYDQFENNASYSLNAKPQAVEDVFRGMIGFFDLY